MKQILISIGLILAIFSASSQPLDSIGLHKVRLQAGKYTLNQFGISKIKLETKGPTAVTDDGIGTGEKVVEGLFTMFTGWTTSSSSESLWQLNNSVKLGGIKKEIAFPVQVTGFYEKTRERVRDESGSSLETYETYNLYWDEGATGSIIEEEDTLGTFALKPMNTLLDSIDTGRASPAIFQCGWKKSWNTTAIMIESLILFWLSPCKTNLIFLFTTQRISGVH